MRQMTESELMAEQRAIAVQVSLYLGEDMVGSIVQIIEEYVDEHVNRVRRNGLDMPKLAVIVMPKSGNIDIVPRDLDKAGIETLIVNLAKKYPGVSAHELGFAINRAFPGYAKLIQVAETHTGWTGH